MNIPQQRTDDGRLGDPVVDEIDDWEEEPFQNFFDYHYARHRDLLQADPNRVLVVLCIQVRPKLRLYIHFVASDVVLDYTDTNAMSDFSGQMTMVCNEILSNIRRQKKYATKCRNCGKLAVRHLIYGHVYPQVWSSGSEASVCSAPKCEASLHREMMAGAKAHSKEIGKDNFRMMKHCGNCKTTDGNPKLLTCAGCKFVYYCSAKCQKLDWKLHKPICRAAQAQAQMKE